ncbi:MAG: 50S ribosomal protein L3 [Phycisphaerales bacterium]|nr:50S ribosomal protein L3 [Phycisphaerae bacterium]NNF44692.1 50S ribosomal protein L3 [Phycisphaerales bacterium]NNM25261.1 50S ribosomal protein L3 [Phycisphaerales bacterium]
MSAALLGRKIGMTRYYMEDGHNVPVTVIEAGPCVVTQVKTSEDDGYASIQIAFGDVAPRRSTMPVIGHDAKAGTTPKRHHREVRLETDAEAEAFELGQSLDVSVFEGTPYVDVTATSKGKGFAGGMKRHNFRGLEASHGVKRQHRRGGSIGGHATNLGTGPKPKKGKRMPGHMGAEQVTVRSLDVISIDPDRNLLLVKGPVPGPNQGLLLMKTARRLNRRKARLAKSG